MRSTGLRLEVWFLREFGVYSLELGLGSGIWLRVVNAFIDDCLQHMRFYTRDFQQVPEAGFAPAWCGKRDELSAACFPREESCNGSYSPLRHAKREEEFFHEPSKQSLDSRGT